MKVKPVKPTLNRQIIDEASAWFVDFRCGDVDQGTRARFDDWLRSSPEHIRAYIEIARTYVVLPTLNPGREVDVGQLIAYARSDGNVVKLGRSPASRSAAASEENRPCRRPPAHIGRHRQSLAAACLAVALAGSILWLMLNRYPTYVAGIGERQSITLADGSVVELDARSKIRVKLLKSRREIDLLEGEALFEVAKDKTRPFIVRSGDLQVQAVGTQFDVDRRRDTITVTVLEGRVAVITPRPESEPHRTSTRAAHVPDGGTPPVNIDLLGVPIRDGVSTLVSAGEQVVATPVAVASPRRVDLADATAWLQHRFVFDGTRLSEVAEDFNRYNARQIVVVSPELDDFHISGVYSSTDPASLIRFLQAQPGIKVTETEDAIRIEQK